MVARKNTALGFIAILITAWFLVFIPQVRAETTDEQKQALIGKWEGNWSLMGHEPVTLIIREIDTANAKARCTYISATRGEKKFPILADFFPGQEPKLEFKVEGNDLTCILKKKVLEVTFRGLAPSGQLTWKTIKEV